MSAFSANDSLPLKERFAKLEEQANSLYCRGDLDGAMALYTECERLAQELGDETRMAGLLGNKANVLTIRGDLDGALELYRGAERRFREVGDKGALATVLVNQAGILSSRGEPDGAMSLYKEAERMCRELGEVHTGMVVIGEKLGLYKALANGPMSSAELAARTQTDERYVREWLASQAAGGYITYEEKTNKFGLTEEQAFTLANESSPAYLPGAFELALGSLAVSCVLFCDAIPIDELMSRINDRRVFDFANKNKNERYQFLREVKREEDAHGQGIATGLGLDFKRYFCLAVEDVYAQISILKNRRAMLLSPYAEHLSLRFFEYQLRIALAKEHHIP
jgi:tetratricopeptide (TPR) repeat protein